jgi:hypothetical protein
MRKLAFIAVLLLVGMLPLAASAQQGAPAVTVKPGEMSVNVGKVVAIGVGVVLGAVVAEAIFIGDAAAVAGGIVGGFLGAWWYDNHGDSVTRVAIRPTTMTLASSERRPILSF